MEWIAVTDHNSVRGVSKAMEEAVSVRVISGVELDCVYRGHDFHLLGYGIDVSREEFWEIEQDILNQERRAAEEKIRLFSQASGIYVDADKILADSENGVVTGEQIAAYVLGRKEAERDERLVPYLPGGRNTLGVEFGCIQTQHTTLPGRMGQRAAEKTKTLNQLSQFRANKQISVLPPDFRILILRSISTGCPFDPSSSAIRYSIPITEDTRQNLLVTFQPAAQRPVQRP